MSATKIDPYLRDILVTLFIANAAAVLIVIASHLMGFGAVGTAFSWQLLFLKIGLYIALIAINVAAAVAILRMDTTV